MKKPLAIDLYAGLGGWAEGFLAEGYRVVGFDIEPWAYPGLLVLQDVLTLHGAQFRDAAIIVASSPCQAYSYRAMPWKRARTLPAPDNCLFDACFRIQREAIEAAGHHIPLIIENVKGAQKWVGRARWHFGSYYLWGDVPALMPSTAHRKGFGKTWFGGLADGVKVGGPKGADWFAKHNRPEFLEAAGLKVPGINLSEVGFNVPAAQRYREGIKQHGSGQEWFDKGIARHSSRSNSRKLASAQIAKIPFPLAQWIARCFKPEVA